MRKIKILFGIFAILAVCQLYSCGKSSNSPVDQYIEVIDQTTKQVEDLKVINYEDMQSLLSPEAAKKIAQEYGEYELTDKDKEKLKKSCGNLMKAVYNKIIDSDEVPQEMKKQLKTQEGLVVAAVDQLVDNARTLGQLDGR